MWSLCFHIVPNSNQNSHENATKLLKYPFPYSGFLKEIGAQWLSGRVAQDWGAADSNLTGITVLCPWARRINPSLELVQPRKTCLSLYNWKIVDGT